MHKANRQIYTLLDISQAFDRVDREKLWAIIDARIERHRAAAEFRGASPEEMYQFEELEVVMTTLKLLYQDHTVVIGKTKVPTHNGVIQGSINSPWLFAVYLEEFLYSNPEVKDLCDRQRLLAFADDMLLISSSWADHRKAMTLLTDALTPGCLLFNKKKSEILTARNRNQPVDLDDWLTDDEDSEVPKPAKKMAVKKELHKMAKKRNRGQSEDTAVDVDMQEPVRKKGDTNIPRKEFTDFDGIAIKTQVKYLGMQICTTIAETIKAVK